MKISTFPKVAVWVAILSALIACSDNTETGAELGLPQVTVAPVLSQEIIEWDEFTGRLEAPETVSLRPRISGYIEDILFEEGALVSKGDVLIKIDASPFEVEVARIEAELAQAVSQYSLAVSEHERAKKLMERQAISKEMAENRLANVQSSEARVDSLEARLDLAQLELSYTEIKAPITGRASRAFITKGNFVTAGQSDLTTLVSTQEMHAYFDADEMSYLKYAKLAKEGTRHSSRDHANPVLMSLINQKDFPYTGKMDFIDNQINVETGTIRGRAVFDNTDGDLIPGMFIRLRLAGSANYEAILIDDQAVGTNLNKRFVLVLDEENRIQYREVVLGKKIGGLRAVTSGLSADEKIVTRGLQRSIPGSQVEPLLAEMANQETLAEIAKLQEKALSVLTETGLATSTNDRGIGEKS